MHLVDPGSVGKVAGVTVGGMNCRAWLGAGSAVPVKTAGPSIPVDSFPC